MSLIDLYSSTSGLWQELFCVLSSDACLQALYIKQRLGFLNGAKLSNVIKEG